MSRGREMAPSMPGFVLTWAPVPTGRAPHTRVAPCRSQLSRAEEIGGCCVQRDPCLRCAVLGTRAPGVKGSGLVSPGHTFAIRAAKREAAGAGAPAPPPRLTPTREGGGGASRRHAGGLRPCAQSASPGVGLAVVRSGAFSSAWASSRGDVFTWGLVRHGCAPRPRAHLSRPPRRERSSFAVESVGGAGFLVTVGPGAHGTLRRPREAARWEAGKRLPT